MEKFNCVLTFVTVILCSLNFSARVVSAKKISPVGGFLFYRVQDGKILYLLLKKRRNGEWSPPKGNIEKGESTFDAAIRETFEETGWDVNADYIISMGNMIHFEYKTRGGGLMKHVDLWPARLFNSEKALQLNDENTNYSWLTYQDALKKIKKQYRRALLECDHVVRDLQSETEAGQSFSINKLIPKIVKKIPAMKRILPILLVIYSFALVLMDGYVLSQLPILFETIHRNVKGDLHIQPNVHNAYVQPKQ